MRYQMSYSVMSMVLLLAPAAALAQPEPKVLVAVGKEVVVNVLDPGTLRCVGGTPTNNPQGPPCSPGTTRILISNRTSVAEYREVTGSSAALLQGQNSILTHCVLDQNYYGRCWGRFTWSIPGAGGQWEGSWDGIFDILTNTISYSAIGHGNGGTLEGLRMQLEAAYTGPGPGFLIAKFSRH